MGYCKKVELNCDMGEGFGKWKMGPDEELIKLVDYANIACGFHAGDPTTMIKTIRLAKEHGVKVGAHPGLDDKFGFGRREMKIRPDDMHAMILYQVGSLKAMLDAEEVELNHIKPHGELFFYMQRDEEIMLAVLRACRTFNVAVFGDQSAKGEADACKEMGLVYVGEAYVDLQYDGNGKLLPAAKSNAPTAELVYERTKSIGLQDTVHTSGVQSENPVTMGFGKEPMMFCIHSDFPTALENAKACRRAIDDVNRQNGWTL